MNYYRECRTCTKWHVICQGVQDDPSGTWNGRNGGCSGHRDEPLPLRVSCERCTRDICGVECNAIRHGRIFDRKSSKVCRFFEDDPKFSPIVIQSQRTLEAFL